MRAPRSSILLLASFVLSLTAAPVGAQPTAADPPAGGGAALPAAHPIVRYAERSDTTPRPLRALPKLPARIGEIFEVPNEADLPGRDEGGAATPDTVVQTQPTSSAPISTGASFEGIGNLDGVLPPDPNGDIGPTQFVETVNLHLAVYNRNGSLAYGPVTINTLWQGFGGACETSNDGDPVVQYDQLADRWMISQFALPRYPRGPFYQCIAVSQTGDATGSWYRYQFLVSDTKLNDYPKFGVWPDAYYMSINQFTCNFRTCSWAGAGAIAFERAALLTGGAARMVYFDLYNTDPNLGGMLPSDLDGSALPPAGAANQFAQMDDNAWGYSPDQLQLWGFHVDWANPAASTFTRTSTLGVSAFDTDMCGYSRNCIPQPGGANLDALSDRLMYRLAYRNFGDHQALLVNHTVDATGNDRAGVRWYELRNGGGGWSVAQESTFSPDATNRWVASAAMNGAGDIAIGYSVSSSSVSPSIRAAGRSAGDPANTLGAEITLKTGAGYQTHSSGRWGDYTSLAVDPTDDCTFWYTGEYTANVSSADWRTFIGSFTISSCGSPTPTAPVADFSASPTSGPAPLNVQFTDTSSGSPTAWSWSFGDGGTSTLQNPSHQYTTAGDYTVSLTASNGAGSDTVTKTSYIHVSTPAPISLSVSTRKAKGIKTADLTWSGATTASVDVFRNGALITTTANDGAYTDTIGKGGAGSYTYRVCEAGTGVCSDDVTVSF